ncbi:hypothetical protein [Streptococcus sp. zg-JUN1979]|uniref:hypothetical protein n=1 Tax=Streptococcus sp. zg-JUN1979 TaxID=3391450 RepID=UPI0039A69299
MFVLISIAIITLVAFVSLFVAEVIRTKKYGVRKVKPLRVLLNWLLIVFFVFSIVGIGVVSSVKSSNRQATATSQKSTSSSISTKKSSSSASTSSSSTSSEASETSQSERSEVSSEETPAQANASVPTQEYAQAADMSAQTQAITSASEEEYWEEGELTSTTIPYSYTTSVTEIVGSRTELVE